VVFLGQSNPKHSGNYHFKKDSELEMVSFTALWGKKVLEKLADIAEWIFFRLRSGLMDAMAKRAGLTGITNYIHL
jgi:hypothetical protein